MQKHFHFINNLQKKKKIINFITTPNKAASQNNYYTFLVKWCILYIYTTKNTSVQCEYTILTTIELR